MYMKDHMAWFVNDGGVGMGGAIVEELCDGVVGLLSCMGLFSC